MQTAEHIPALRFAEILFGTQARTSIMRLLSDALHPLTARQIARLTGTTAATVTHSLEPLVRMRIVLLRGAGRAYQYTLNREHLLVEQVVTPLFEAERQYSAELARDLVAAFQDVAESIVIFGSLVRGEARAGDLDVLVVARPQLVDGAQQKAETEGQHFFNRFGLPLEVTVATEDGVRRGLPYLLEAEREGVLLWGKPLEEVKGHGRRIQDTDCDGG